MVNYLYRVIEVYQKLILGEELSPGEIWEAGRLLGTPTRKVDALLSRYSDVLGRLIEERCSGVGGYRICIYTWSKWSFKRYFPAALDAGGTIIAYKDDKPDLVSYPLHRAFDVDVKGVSVPEDQPIITPRIDGWQVNLYWDPILGKPVYSTRFVLHNMFFEGKTLRVHDYGVITNPVVKAADYISDRLGLYEAAKTLEGWTLTFMMKSEKPALAVKRPPRPWDGEKTELILIAARKPEGYLLDPEDIARLSTELGVRDIYSFSLKKENIIVWAENQVEYPSIFLWFLDRGDREHPEIYEVKSIYYNDYIKASYNNDAKSLIVLLTSGIKDIVDAVKLAIGEALVDETSEALGILHDALKNVDPERIRQVLEATGINRRMVKSAIRAISEGKSGRALRIIAASSVEGFKLEDAPLILKHLARTLRE